MTFNDPLANMYSNILNSEKIGKKECIIRPASAFMKENLRLLKEKGYIEDYQETVDNKGNLLTIKLNGRINKCNVIKPRFSVKVDNYEKFEKRFLPARNFGILLVSTPRGLVVHETAKEQRTGGRLVAYCY
ncbi:30S ribosomal protein S8 [Candidatus Woesearchaeota archaeon]|nr:30S ribosomal protein S8 [Candidatus Woesearchaeota archaeon]